MVLGIVAVATAWIPFVTVLGALAALLALIFGIVAFRRSGRVRRRTQPRRGRPGHRWQRAARRGTRCTVLTFVVLDVYDSYLNPPPHEAVITSCEVVGSRAIATGRLENLGDDTSDFSVLVGFVRPGTDNPHRTTRVTLDDVGAGASAVFDAERQIDLDAVDCVVIEVTGPLPFGLALD